MSTSGAKGMLLDAMKELKLRVSAAREQWSDQTRQKFEQEEILPLEARVLAAMRAMDAMHELTYRVQRECGDDGES